MRVYTFTHGGNTEVLLRASFLGAAIVLLTSCGAPAPPSYSQLPSTPTNPAPTPTPMPLVISSNCGGVALHPGTYVPLACLLFVQGGSDPRSNTSNAFADLHIFGRESVEQAGRCPACDGPPWTFDMDIDIPADMSPGVKTFPIWAIDPQGNRADSTASIEIASR